MSAIALEALADETGGQLVGESVALQTLAIDSRKVKAGALFAALSGQRVDGHDFAPQALWNNKVAFRPQTFLDI